MKTVLVTGGSGFIGSRTLGRLVKRGYRVHAVSRGDVRQAGGVHWHRADVLDPAAMDALVSSVRPTHLLHLAWITEHGKYWTAPINTAWLTASLYLLEVFGRSGGKRAVGVGTCAEYDWTCPGPYREGSPLGPTSLYGAAKASLGLMQAQLAHSLGFEQAWCRPFFLYGPGENPQRLIPSLISAMLRGEAPVCNKPDAIRDFLHIDDVAGAIVTVLDSDHEGPVNIGSGDGVALGLIAQILMELAGLESAPQTGSDVQLAASDCVVTDTSVLSTLGFRPRHTLRSGLTETLGWWRDQAAVGEYGA
ncbi:MAG: NAD(P)-dependent oxidoreductase [Acidobacteriota bacterium]